MKTKRYLMIACRNIEDEIEAARKEVGANYPILYLPAITHAYPQKMNQALQDLIQIISDIDYLLLPMGRCGNATIGLSSDKFSIVLPKCEDCINLLLSEDSLSVDRPRGHMFFTDGWLRTTMAVDKEYDQILQKYGKEGCKDLMQMLYGSYSHFTLLNTGLYDMNRTKKTLSPLAKAANVKFDEKQAPFGILKRMCALEIDSENFVIVPPKKTIHEGMLKM